MSVLICFTNGNGYHRQYATENIEVVMEAQLKTINSIENVGSLHLIVHTCTINK